MDLPPGCVLLLAALLLLAKRSSLAPHKTGQEGMGMGECGWVMAWEWGCSVCCCSPVLPTAPYAARCLQVWDCVSLGSHPGALGGCCGPCSVPLTSVLATVSCSKAWVLLPHP